MSGNLKALKEHVRAVKNIKKITSSMKAVSAAKFVNAEKALRGARPLGIGGNRFYDVSKVRAEVSAPEITFYAVTSDRGLCGSMHNKVCKFVKLTAKVYDKNFDVVCIGEKGRGILVFDMRRNISLVVNGVGHGAPSFIDAGRIMQKTLSRPEFTVGNIVYCKFKNMLSFDVDSMKIFSVKLLSSSPWLLNYEQDIEVLTCYIEFSQTMLMYYAMCETFLVELSSRINAMSSAAKNAGKLAENLALELNRKRQQIVTTELIDIVSGANVIAKK